MQEAAEPEAAEAAEHVVAEAAEPVAAEAAAEPVAAEAAAGHVAAAAAEHVAAEAAEHVAAEAVVCEPAQWPAHAGGCTGSCWLWTPGGLGLHLLNSERTAGGAPPAGQGLWVGSQSTNRTS